MGWGVHLMDTMEQSSGMMSETSWVRGLDHPNVVIHKTSYKVSNEVAHENADAKTLTTFCHL
jgi:hypothetical protein